MFDVHKNKQQKRNKQQKIILVGSMAALLAACGGEGKKHTSGDVDGYASDENDVFTIGGNGKSGVVAAGKGNDKITGGAKADYISGGLGADKIAAGGGLDILALVGITKDADYGEADLVDVGGTKINLNELLDHGALRNHVNSDVVAGEEIDGGADGAWLFIFGDVDFEGVELNNITKIFLDGEVLISKGQIRSLIDDGGLVEIIGTGTLRSSSGMLDLDGLKIAKTVDVADSGGVIITPALDPLKSIGTTVSVAESSKIVGKFVILDETAVGDISYSIGGSDAKFFKIDSKTGELSFKKSPDFENPLDNGEDNVYVITMTATDEHGKSINHNVAITVTDVAGDPLLQVVNSSIEVGAEFLVNSEANANQFEAVVGGMKNGGYVVAWRTDDNAQDGSNSAIKAQIYAANGTKLAAEFLVNSAKTDPQEEPVLAVLNDGGFVIVWTTLDASQDNDDAAIKAQIFDAEGGLVGTEFLVNKRISDDQSQPSVTALSNGGFAVAWTTADTSQDGESTAIKAQVYLADGTKSGSEFLVNEQGDDGQHSAEITGLAGGGFVVSWVSDDTAQDGSKSAVKAQIYTINGGKVGGEFLVNEQKVSDQDEVSIAGLSGGGFVAVWQTNDSDQDTDGDALKAQIYAANGDLVGTEFLVNSKVTDNQEKPKVTALNDGGFFVVWENTDISQDGSGASIKGQAFNAIGSKIGEELLINSKANDDQLSPDVAALADGGFIITWHTEDSIQDGSGDAIKAQIFAYSPTLKFDAGQTYDFNINAQASAAQSGGELGKILLSGVPDGVSFNNGSLSKGVLSLDEDELAGLEITFKNGFSEKFEFIVTVSSTDNAGGVLTTQINVPISVGKQVSGAGANDTFNANSSIDHITGGEGIDLVKFNGSKADYDFAILGNDLQVTHIASGQKNVDLLHGVEQLKFGGESTFDVHSLDNDGDIVSLTGDVYDTWLVDNYQFDLA